MSLIDQIREAVVNKNLIEPFTTAEVKSWIIEYEIVQDNGKEYAESSKDSILSDSDIKNNRTSNLNKKVLTSELNKSSQKVYYFLPTE